MYCQAHISLDDEVPECDKPVAAVRDVVRQAMLPLLVVLLLACSSSSYPMPVGPPHARQFNPAAVGTPVQAVVLYLEPRPGDRIELLGAEGIGVAKGAIVRFYLSRPVLKPSGDRVIGEELEQLAGAVIGTAGNASPGPENDVGIVAEMTSSEPGRYELTSVRLRYHLNGGAEQAGDGIDLVFTVCAADPAPASCEE
jgi:hypothetical protein